MNKKICVVGGAGYVGLITGLGLAELGHTVVNVDVDEKRVAQLQAGEPPMYEEGILPVLQRNLASGRISFSTDLHEALARSTIVFVAVGTPAQEDGHADLSQIIEVADELASHLASYRVVVLKSTVPVGAVELVLDILRRSGEEGRDFDIVVNPEFLREGKGLRDFFHPDRIVIGSSSERASEMVRALYEPILRGTAGPPDLDEGAGEVPILQTDLASAQMIKYASNAFLAMRISYINEIAGLCDRVGADVKEVVRGLGYDSRIGDDYLAPGLGFGGPCLEKDLRALIKVAESHNYEPQILRAVLDRNNRQLEEVISKTKELVGPLLYGKQVAVFGLAFKVGTSDVRNSLALRVIERLEEEGAVVRAHDPIAIPEARVAEPHIGYCDDRYEAVTDADVLLILTDWPQFVEVDYERVMAAMQTPCIVDARNMLDAAKLRKQGFSYLGMGVS